MFFTLYSSPHLFSSLLEYTSWKKCIFFIGFIKHITQRRYELYIYICMALFSHSPFISGSIGKLLIEFFILKTYNLQSLAIYKHGVPVIIVFLSLGDIYLVFEHTMHASAFSSFSLFFFSFLSIYVYVYVCVLIHTITNTHICILYPHIFRVQG